MTLAAKYRTSAAGRAAMQETDLIPALVNWYDKVLKNDVLSEIVKEVNEELDDDDDVRHVDGLAALPASRKRVISELALSDLMSPVVPYNAAEEGYSLVDLRRALRMGGMIDEGDSKDDLVTAIMDRLPGPMLSAEDFPEGEQQRAARGAEAAFDFTPYLGADGSTKRPREDAGALEGTLEDALAAVLAKKAKAIAKAREAGSAGGGFMAGPSAGGSTTKDAKYKLGVVSMLAGVGGRKADTLEDIRMRLEKEQIESLQKNKKVENVGTTAIMLNSEIDNQTECLVRLAELESAVKVGDISQAAYLSTQEVFTAQLAKASEKAVILKAVLEKELTGKQGWGEGMMECYKDMVKGSNSHDSILRQVEKQGKAYWHRNQEVDMAQCLLTSQQTAQMTQQTLLAVASQLGTGGGGYHGGGYPSCGSEGGV